MADQAEQERTAGGLLGKAIGKAKEVAGELANNDELAREGRLQQAQGEAGIEAARAAREAEFKRERAAGQREEVETDVERARLENEVASELGKRQAETDRQRAEQAAAGQAVKDTQRAERARAAEQVKAAQSVATAERAQEAAAQDAQTLEHAARRAEQRADAIDPQEAA